MTLGLVLMPGVSFAHFGAVDADARIVPWSGITRLALEGGVFPPAYRPVTTTELADLLATVQDHALSGRAPALTDDREYGRLQWLLHRYRAGGGGVVHHGCACKTHPLHWRLAGRVLGGYSELGDPLPAEGGLNFAAGHNLVFEPAVELALGSFWAALDWRIGGRWARGGVAFDGPTGDANPLTWPGWSRATGRADVRDARLRSGAWRGQVSRALIGLQLGNWALSAGWDHRRTGPGLSGQLNLDYQGRPFPALTARRTRPFRWFGMMSPLAPDQMLLRAGLLSSRTVDFQDEYGTHRKQDEPWFFQWLVGWQLTPWFRTQLTHSVMVNAREGTLWPDLLQVNFPLVGTTWREGESGPITDRIFAAQTEFRWREAPWPVLPSRAGRLFWDYGGTDFLPSGPGGVVPEISIPASVLGCELLSPNWDLGFEYAELRHDDVLWYSNGGYVEGYSHEQTLLGHPLGGSGEAITGVVRIRPARWGCQLSLQGRRSRWGTPGLTPGTGERHAVALILGGTPRDRVVADATAPAATLVWEVSAEWNRERVDPAGYLHDRASDSGLERDWWRLLFKVGI